MTWLRRWYYWWKLSRASLRQMDGVIDGRYIAMYFRIPDDVHFDPVMLPITGIKIGLVDFPLLGLWSKQ